MRGTKQEEESEVGWALKVSTLTGSWGGREEEEERKGTMKETAGYVIIAVAGLSAKVSNLVPGSGPLALAKSRS